MPPPGDGSLVAGHARLQAAIIAGPLEGDFKVMAVAGRLTGRVGQQVVAVPVQPVTAVAEVHYSYVRDEAAEQASP